MVIGTALGLSNFATIALASDTASIALMELVDNDSLLFWGSLAVALLIAGTAAYPLNRWLISRGKGHAVIHAGEQSRSPR